MALINCPKCGKEISDRGQLCPHCKTWLNEANDPVFQKPSKVYLIQGFVFLIIAIALLVFGLWASSTGGIVFVGLGVFVFVIAVVSFNEHKKVVHKHHLANTDYAAYEEYIKNEREKERETQEFQQKQKDEKEAKKLIESEDKSRSEYYRHYTGRDWTDARNYNLCLDTSSMSYEKCVEIVKAYIAVLEE